MKEKYMKVWDITTTIITAIFVLLAFLLVFVRYIGFQPLIVLSGSMEPAYPTGSLVYVKETDVNKLKPGDVITFKYLENTPATHRIVEVLHDKADPSALLFQTKGDANEAQDKEPVKAEDVIGKVVFMIPYLGYFSSLISTGTGKYLFISFAAIVVISIFTEELSKRNKAKEKHKENEALS